LADPSHFPKKPSLSLYTRAVLLDTITSIEGITPATDEIGDLRTTNGTASGSIDLGAVQLLSATEASPTTIIPGSARINYYDATPSPVFTITAAVNAELGGTASGGTLSIYLNSDNANPPTYSGWPTLSSTTTTARRRRPSP
jgi:hypothetical protein